MLSVHHAGHLSYGILKQVQEDFGISKYNGALFVAHHPKQSPVRFLPRGREGRGLMNYTGMGYDVDKFLIMANLPQLKKNVRVLSTMPVTQITMA